MTEGAMMDLSLVCRIDGVLCALPVEHVVETMRPLPVEPLAGAPAFVRGLSIIRGAPVPVVDAASLLGSPDTQPTRFVMVKAGARRVALAVSDVIGVRALAPEKLQALPPLLREAAADIVTSIGALDDELLLVLRSARLVPDAVWTSAEIGRSAS